MRCADNWRHKPGLISKTGRQCIPVGRPRWRPPSKACGNTDTVTHFPFWKALLGYADEPAATPLAAWISRIHPDDEARVRREMQQHMEGKAPFYESLHRIRHHDGSYHWLLDRGRITERDPHGAPLRILGTKLEASSRQLTQELLDQLVENVPGMLYQYQLDPDGSSRFPYTSAGIREIYGLSPEDVREDASPAFARIHPDDLKMGVAGIQASARTLGMWHADYRVLLPGRGERWLRGTAKPQRLENGATLWHGYLYDFTHDKQQALKLGDTERLLRRLMSDMPMGLCLVDENGNFYFRNRHFEQLFAIPAHEPMTLDRWWQQEYPDPEYRQQVIRTWNADVADARAHDGKIPQRDYQVTLPDGSLRIMAIGGLVFGQHFMATFEDRTEQVTQNEQLHKMAYIDGLTGIANRRHFDETLQTEWRRCLRSGKPLALLMLDIDHFKAYNDLYGHLSGDECLQAVASTLHDGLGRAQDMAARYGGEEFVCLLPECDLDGALRVAESLRASVQALHIEHKGSPVAANVTVSVGVAVQIPDAGTRAEDILARADAHLYRAKQDGRNRVKSDG